MKISNKFSTENFTEKIFQKTHFTFLNNKSVLRSDKRACFIVFEGLDGSGHTTQANLLKDFLIKKGFIVVLTKEPTIDSKEGKEIRKVLTEKQKVSPKKLQELFTKDRKSHLRNVIIPALEKGNIVISDRYFFSSFAYGVSDGLDLDWLIQINKDFLLPDITFILKVKPEICLKRIEKRGEKKELFEEKEKLAKVWEAYKILPTKFKNINVIDGEKPIKDVLRAILLKFF